MIDFYKNVLKLKLVGQESGLVEFSGDPISMFVDRNDSPDIVLELVVPDAEKAKAELVSAGCEVICWEGKGKDCYIRDPFGIMFNIWEDPKAFS
jgi:catechol 2,3-dioxygenase-like lactoylglutathione lyase family enzyme